MTPTRLADASDTAQGLAPAPGSETAPRLSFVVPAHNEAETLPLTIPVLAERLARYPGSEIIIVENGSSDDTYEVASRMSDDPPFGVPVRAQRSAPGIGAAYRRGIETAINPIVICSAADLPFGFTDLDGYLDRGCPTLAIGSKAHRASQVHRSILRSLMSFVFLLLRRLLLGLRVGDPQGTFLMHTTVADALARRCDEDGFAFTTELTALAAVDGIDPLELPIVLEPERRASTVRPLRDGRRMIAALLRIRRSVRVRELERTRAWCAPRRSLVAWAQRDIDVKGRRSGLVNVASKSLVFLAAVPAALVLTTLLASILPDGFDRLAAVMGLVAVTVGVVVAVRSGERDNDIDATSGPSTPEPDELSSDLTAPPATGRGLARRSAEFAAFVFGALVMIAPASAHLTTQYAGYEDSHYWFWMSWRSGQALRQGQSFWHFADVIWPYGLDIRAADGLLPTMVGGVWSAIIPNPVLAYNLAIITALVSTGLAGRWLAARVTPERWIQLVVGLALMTATLTSVRVNMHYNLLFTFPAVVMVGRAIEVAAGGRIRPVRDGVLLALAYVSSGYFLVYGAIAVAMIVAFAPRRHRAQSSTSERRRSPLAPMALALLVAGALLSPLLIAKLRLEHDESRAGAKALSDESVAYSADAFSLLQPPPDTFALPGPVIARDAYASYAQEATTFPGVLLLAGLIGLVALPGRLRRPLLLTTFGLWLLSLGPRLSVNGLMPIDADWLPTSLLLRLPGMRGVRDPNRSAFLILPVAAVALALCLERGRSLLTPHRRRVVLAMGALMLIGLRIPVSMAPASPASAEVRSAMRSWAASDAPGAVLVLPDQCTFTLHNTRLQIDLRRPFVGCQGFSASLPFASGMPAYRASDAWASLRCLPPWLGRTLFLPEFDGLRPNNDAVSNLRAQLGVGLVVFDRQNNCHEIGDQVFAALSARATLIADDGRIALFELP
ncbi:MAG: glycosyltransferase [Acidimicrobiia bacterium]